ncbi:MAG: peptidyl-prolyl cis-trans isomerase [Fimbriimonadales bacterium]
MKKAIFAGLVLAAVGIAIGQVDPQRVVATVNGVDIKGAEYYRRMEFLPGVGRNLGESFAEFPPGFLTLEQLITEKLVFQLAKDKDVMPTEPEVQDELRYRLGRNPKLLDDWVAAGRTRAELEYEVKFDLAQFKILTAGITVTDQEVEKYYKDFPTTFTVPAQASLRVIVVRTQADADAVDQELAAGKAFADVAKAHSADVTAARGGDYGTVPVTYLSPQVSKAVQTIKVGATTQWFSATPNPNAGPDVAKFKFLLEKFVQPVLQTLDADLRRQIRQQIMMENGKKKNNIKKELNALRAKATIDIKEKGFSDAYKKFMDAYLKASGGGG